MQRKQVLNDISYVMEWVGSLVHSTVQQFGDAKLLYAPSYFVRGSTQDVICLREEDEDVFIFTTQQNLLENKNEI